MVEFRINGGRCRDDVCLWADGGVWGEELWGGGGGVGLSMVNVICYK